MINVLVALGHFGLIVSIIVSFSWILLSDEAIQIVICVIRRGTIALVLLLNLLTTIVESACSCISHQFYLPTVFSILFSVLLQKMSHPLVK
jgi:hypothetical protein